MFSYILTYNKHKDEPTSGMDVVSKRSLWDFITSTMKDRSVILTSHSMEEVEALSNKIGIMIKGQLSCFGTNNHFNNILCNWDSRTWFQV